MVLMTPHTLTTPLAMLDFFTQCMVLLFLAQLKASPVDAHKLPALRVDQGDHAKTSPPEGCRLTLNSEGKMTYENQPVDRDGLLRLLKTEEDTRRPVLLIAETADRGQGALEAFVQMQLDLSKAGLWDRVRVMTRGKPAPSSGSDAGAPPSATPEEKGSL